ncbi:putative heavy metal-associated domain, HMA, heavy metal-associated domain superfamily [Dioscorea sansibarensis]
MDTKQALRFAENLSLPKVQVIVMRANMSCDHCRKRVSQVISKMNGLVDYMVDMNKKEVVVRGLVSSNSKKQRHYHDQEKKKKKKKLPNSFGLHRLMCFSAT